MKNIGLITIIDNDNYGNRLQNYALGRYLEKNFNVKVTTLLNDDFSNEKKLYFIRKIKHILVGKKYKKVLNKKRYASFSSFNSNINFTSKKINCFSTLKEYDFIIVGSDQVWNPYFRRLRDVDVLKNVPVSKRIAYAASFGVANIAEKYNSKFKEIQKFKAISVREKTGEELLRKKIVRNDIEVLVDPTMLISSNEWNNVIRKPKEKLEDKYILLYFLGEINTYRKNSIKEFAAKYDCKIINVLDKESSYYEYGPGEFLYLIKNAFLICTDSFHSCVFSIIFDKPFVVFEREQNHMQSMNTRIETLLDKFELSNQIYNGTNISSNNLKHDYNRAFNILKEEQKRSYSFFVNALEIKDSD